jgi:hypothetical protein
VLIPFFKLGKSLTPSSFDAIFPFSIQILEVYESHNELLFYLLLESILQELDHCVTKSLPLHN